MWIEKIQHLSGMITTCWEMCGMKNRYHTTWSLEDSMARHKIQDILMERVSSWECKPSANERWTESEIQVVMPMCRPDLQRIYTLWENFNVSKVKGELDANNSPENQTHRYGSKKCRAEPRRMWNWIYPKKGCIPKSNGFKPHFPIKIATISGRRTPCFHKPSAWPSTWPRSSGSASNLKFSSTTSLMVMTSCLNKKTAQFCDAKALIYGNLWHIFHTSQGIQGIWSCSKRRKLDAQDTGCRSRSQWCRRPISIPGDHRIRMVAHLTSDGHCFGVAFLNTSNGCLCTVSPKRAPNSKVWVPSSFEEPLSWRSSSCNPSTLKHWTYMSKVVQNSFPTTVLLVFRPMTYV